MGSSSDVDVEKKEPKQVEEVADGNHTLSEAHREYLISRHGTADLDPLPDMTDEDPYNWPKYRKVINLVLVAFHAMMATFTAAAIQSAFENISIDLGVSLQRTSYLVSLVIAVLGGAPLFWRPLSDRFGRRPIFLLSLLCSLVGNIGCAVSPSYGTMGLCRAITAFCISPAAAIGSAVVTETFFKKERARYMGIWTIFVTLGVPIAPFIFGFVALRVSYRWIYWILAIVNAVQFLLYVPFGPETLYLRGQQERPKGLFRFGRINPKPLTLFEFVQPLTFAIRSRVFLPAAAYSMVFLLAGILPTIMIPQLYVEFFGLNTQQVGLQFLSVIVGTLIGEPVGGRLSDWWMQRARVRNHREPAPEHRLWLSYIGYALAILGTAIFLAQLEAAGETWNITPIIGVAIGSAGNQIVTTVLITYAIDCYREQAAAVGVFITFVRQVWGFIGPFWFPQMLEEVGLKESIGIVTALMVVASVLPTVFLQVRGRMASGKD